MAAWPGASRVTSDHGLPAHHLVFSQPLSSAKAGCRARPAVNGPIRCRSSKFGNLITTIPPSSPITLGNNPSGGTLSALRRSRLWQWPPSAISPSTRRGRATPWRPQRTASMRDLQQLRHHAGSTANTWLSSSSRRTLRRARPSAPRSPSRLFDQFNNLVTNDTSSSDPGHRQQRGRRHPQRHRGRRRQQRRRHLHPPVINKAGNGYTLAATTAGLEQAFSSTFNITPGPATTLRFSVQPTATPCRPAIQPSGDGDHPRRVR